MSTVEYERQELRRRLMVDTPFWASQCATILNTQRQPVKLVARPWQARTPETPAGMVPLDEALELQRAAGKPMRVIILKARKLGMSTWVQARFMQRLTQRPFEYALSIAHNQAAAGQLYDMAKLMYERLPLEQELGVGFSIKPGWIGGGSTRLGVRWMALGDKMRPAEASVYETMTAGSKGGGRAATPSMMHGSEIAHYEDPDFIIGALNAVPKEPETIVVLESTANGFNPFYDRWMRAVEGAEDPETGGLYVPLFYGWQHNPFNAITFDSDVARDRFEKTVGDADGGGDEEEVGLIESFGVTLEQLRWRRVTISEECDGKLELFHQEHPTTPEEAFIGSGHPVFAGILIARAIKEATESHEPVEGVLRPADWTTRNTKAGTIRIPLAPFWVPTADNDERDLDLWGPRGRLTVWEQPVTEVTRKDASQPVGQYVVFVDVAQGIGTTTEERDFSAIQVIDHESQMQVARYVSRVDIHDLPLIAYMVGLYYNTAWLAPEVTGLGIGVVDALVKDLRYPRIYRRRRAGDDRRQDQREELLGWQTDMRTKPLMEQTFGQALKEGTHGLRDPLTARQFTTYVITEKGKHEAQKGTHDDLVMSYMGAKRVAFELRPRRAASAKRRHHVADELTGW